MFERTLIFLKPNTVSNNESVFCMKWLCKHGFIKRMQTAKKSKKFFLKFYKHVPQPNQDNHAAFCSSGYIVIMLLTGDKVVERVKKTIGTADASISPKRTLREILFKKYPQKNGYDNFIHASGSVADAEKEIKIFFGGK